MPLEALGKFLFIPFTTSSGEHLRHKQSAVAWGARGTGGRPRTPAPVHTGATLVHPAGLQSLAGAPRCSLLCCAAGHHAGTGLCSATVDTDAVSRTIAK